MEFSRPKYWSGYSLSLLQRNLPYPGIEPRSPTLQVDSLPAKPQGKSKNTGVGSPSLLRGIFLTQELNWGLLHCRQILYQLSHQGNPKTVLFFFSILHTKKLRHKINGLFKIPHIYKWLSLQNWSVRFYKYVLLIPALYCFLLLTLYLTMCSHVHPCNVDNVFIVWGLL